MSRPHPARSSTAMTSWSSFNTRHRPKRSTAGRCFSFRPGSTSFYVMDLQPKNSLIKWAVDQGHTLFVVSWRNPRQELAHKDFEDYMREGPLARPRRDRAGDRRGGEVNLLGFCIGGILSVATLAYMAAKRDRRVKSATFLATMVDLQDVGEVSVFVDDDQLESLERHVAQKGYLEGHHMASMFKHDARERSHLVVRGQQLPARQGATAVSTCSTGTPTRRACQRPCW